MTALRWPRIESHVSSATFVLTQSAVPANRTLDLGRQSQGASDFSGESPARKICLSLSLDVSFTD